jgi:hypothetical protein
MFSDRHIIFTISIIRISDIEMRYTVILGNKEL